jgi:hypothetical protein
VAVKASGDLATLHTVSKDKEEKNLTSGWVFIALGLPVTTKRGVFFLLKCHNNYKLN